jgi:hypothetical protein
MTLAAIGGKEYCSIQQWFYMHLDLPPASPTNCKVEKSVNLWRMMDMKKSRFSEEQIIGFLKQAEAGMPVVEICCKGGFSEATFYKW